jgi:ABC-type transport system substrate-binding protein
MLYAGVPMWMYENDEIDLTYVGASDVERVTDPTNSLNADLHIVPALSTSRLIFDVTMPPFDDPLVRQAFAYAVDRQKLTEVVLKGMSKPAYTILPPGMPGYGEDITAPRFDPDKALEVLAASSYGSADALPEITLTTSGRGGALSDYQSALVDMWRTHLGVEVTVEQLEPTSFFFEVREHHGQIISLGWGADYPDPENFLDVLYHSEGQQNLGHYSNPEVDELLEQARVETDVEARLALYHQIEQMIIDDAPDILVHQGQDYFLLKPYVKNYLLTPVGISLTWRVVSIERPTE